MAPAGEAVGSDKAVVFPLVAIPGMAADGGSEPADISVSNDCDPPAAEGAGVWAAAMAVVPRIEIRAKGKAADGDPSRALPGPCR